MKYRKKPVVIDATQWFKNGDHPEDHPTQALKDANGEGEVVRYFRHPTVPASSPCPECGQIMHVHGWIDTKEGGHRVCPGDWIITGVKGERYPCKPDIFDATYNPEPPTDVNGFTSTGNSEADSIINRLNSSDPDFEDCAIAAALIYRLVADAKGPVGFPTWKDAAIHARSQRVDSEALLERTAQLLAHRACTGAEHDPSNGKIHGYCVTCGMDWPCEYAGTPPEAT